MSEKPAASFDNNEMDALVMEKMRHFILESARLTHAPNWEVMSKNLENSISSMGIGIIAPITQELAVVIKLQLPKIKQIIKQFYNTDKEVMLQKLKLALNAVPS